MLSARWWMISVVIDDLPALGGRLRFDFRAIDGWFQTGKFSGELWLHRRRLCIACMP
jgi:hypothetical protein